VGGLGADDLHEALVGRAVELGDAERAFWQIAFRRPDATRD
jgi:hypothetical protein